MGIASFLCGLSGWADQSECPVGQLSDISRVVPKLKVIPVRLLQVVAQDEVVFARVIGGPALQPIGETLVKLGPLTFWQTGIRGVPDEEMAEAVCLLTGEDRTFRPDQLPASQARQSPREL